MNSRSKWNIIFRKKIPLLSMMMTMTSETAGSSINKHWDAGISTHMLMLNLSHMGHPLQDTPMAPHCVVMKFINISSSSKSPRSPVPVSLFIPLEFHWRDLQDLDLVSSPLCCQVFVALWQCPVPLDLWRTQIQHSSHLVGHKRIRQKFQWSHSFICATLTVLGSSGWREGVPQTRV